MAYGKYSRLFLTKVNLRIHVAGLVSDGRGMTTVCPDFVMV